MLNLNIIDEVVAFLNEELKDLPLPTKDENIEKAPTVYDGYLPPKKNARRGEDTESDDYPYVIVRYLGEEDDLEKENEISLRIIVGTYIRDEQHGWRDTVNVMNRIKIALRKQQFFGSAKLKNKIDSHMFEEQLKPIFHGVIDIGFSVPQAVLERSVLDDY